MSKFVKVTVTAEYELMNPLHWYANEDGTEFLSLPEIQEIEYDQFVENVADLGKVNIVCEIVEVEDAGDSSSESASV